MWVAVFESIANYCAMRNIFRWLLGTPTTIPPPKPPEPSRDWVRDLFERVSILEGDAAGIKIAVETLAESLHKHVAKMNARMRKAAELEQKQETVDIDPRIAALRGERSRQ